MQDALQTTIISIGKNEASQYDYVNDITFGIDALSSNTIKFYKVDDSKDYTYPIVNNNSIVDVSFE